VSTVEGSREHGRFDPNLLPISPLDVTRGKSPGWWGMVFLIFTEATFFTILLTSYWYIRFRSGPVWPPDGHLPNLFLVSIMTPILLLSSAPMSWAEQGIKKGRQWQLRLGLFATFVMGATFLILQGVEYAEKLKELTPRTNAYGTLFFSITGFHGLHVAVGLLLNLWLQYWAWRGMFSERTYGQVENIALYWHFVDAVWVFILASLYLAPRFWP
jgi:heme/copper-type cytochrome/quinol oxidase subunit 3